MWQPGHEFVLTPAERNTERVLIAHAVLAVLVWALFAPFGAIVLRLNIPSLPLLKIHGSIMVLSYITYIVAAGMGIWLAIGSAKYKPVWTDPHPIIGLMILGAALIQPFLGLIHHAIFKKRHVQWKADATKPKPGRTVLGRIHLWIGRILITFGIINGGLGIRLAAGSPFQTHKTTQNVYIAYGVLGGLMWLLYASVSTIFAYRRTARLRQEKLEKSRMYKKTQDTESEEALKV